MFRVVNTSHFGLNKLTMNWAGRELQSAGMEPHANERVAVMNEGSDQSDGQLRAAPFIFTAEIINGRFMGRQKWTLLPFSAFHLNLMTKYEYAEGQPMQLLTEMNCDLANQLMNMLMKWLIAGR